MFSEESTDQNRTINHEMREPCVGWRHMLIAAVDCEHRLSTEHRKTEKPLLPVRPAMTFSPVIITFVLVRPVFLFFLSTLLCTTSLTLICTTSLTLISSSPVSIHIVIHNGCHSRPYLCPRCPPLRCFGYSKNCRCCGLDLCPGQGYSS